MTKLHFICIGNIYRSRMAEAYTNSLSMPNIYAVSSGLAITDTELDVSPYAVYALERFGAKNYLALHKKQTDEVTLEGADIIVFMSIDAYQTAKAAFDFSDKKYEVWNVEDLGIQFQKVSRHPHDTALARRLAVETLTEIRSKVDALLMRL